MTAEQGDRAREHERASPAISGLIVVAAGASLVFEQSPANEIIRTNAGLNMLERTGSAAAVGLVVAAITVAIEFTSALLITLGLHSQGGLVQRLKARMKRANASRALATPGESRGRVLGRFGADVAVALGLGAGLVTVRHHVASSEPTVGRDLAVSAKATAIVACVSGMIGYLVGGGLANAERVGLATPAGWIIDYGTDTRFWVSILVIGYAFTLLVRYVRTRGGGQVRAETRSDVSGVSADA